MHFAARGPDGRAELVAIAPCQLGLSYAHSNWLVAVTQAEDELFAPIRTQLWHLLSAFAVMAIAVLVIAVWFSIRLAAPPIEPGMHISEHPEVPRMEDESV